MLLAQGLGGLQSILLGIGILLLAFYLRRGAVRARQLQSRDVPAEVGRELAAAERAAASSIEGLETRLHDYGREIDGRSQTRIAQLDQLVIEADRAIGRLEELLGRARSVLSDSLATSTAAQTPASGILCDERLTLEQRMIVTHLLHAGYRAEQIARLLGWNEAAREDRAA